MRDWQRNLLLTAASFACAAMFAEVALRLFWQPGGQQSVIHADPLYGWALRPQAHMHSVDTDRGLHYSIAINALGQRDHERRRDKPEGVRRVLFLGDSFIFGAGVETGERCTDRLQAMLGSHVDIVNAAVSGWGTDQEFLYLCNAGLALRPDIVVVGFCVLNDVLNNMLPHELFGTSPKPRFVLRDERLVLEAAATRPSPTLAARVTPLLRHSRLLHFVGRHARMLHRRPKSATPRTQAPYYPEDLESDHSHWAVYRSSYTPRFEAAFRVTEALIGALRDTCAAHGVPVVLFAFPQKVEIDARARAEELGFYGYDPSQFDLEAPYRRLRALAERLGVSFVYPLEAFESEHRSQGLFFERDGHPNAAGQAAAARALGPVLRAELERLDHRQVTSRH
jgi:lysophospholipase L1-like esterase